jgi:uncharacterized protein DUF3631
LPPKLAQLADKIAAQDGRGSSPETTRALLEDVQAFPMRFIVFPDDHYPIVVALWVLHTHAVAASECTPYLNVESPEKRSGKTRLLEVLAALARNSIHAANVSEAALFRMLGAEPTVLLDEVDALFASGAERMEALRNVINSGNRRGVDVLRCVGPNQVPTPFKVFSPKVLAGIDTGRLPDTIRDRSITLRMKRKISTEPVERLLWPKVRPDAEQLRDRIAEWAAQHVEALTSTEPDLPRELDDRAAEAWWSLLAIADLAGGKWPAMAREAAVAIAAAGVDDEESLRMQLLSDVRAVFGESLAIHTQVLLDALNELEEAPWGGWHEAKGLRARDLARRLKPFGVKSKKVKVAGESLQGYHRDDLEDAWIRYLPHPGEPAEPMEPPPVYRAFEVPFPNEVPEPENKTEPETPHSNGKVPEVPEVPLPPAGHDPDAEYDRLAAKFPDLFGGAS